MCYYLMCLVEEVLYDLKQSYFFLPWGGLALIHLFWLVLSWQTRCVYRALSQSVTIVQKPNMSGRDKQNPAGL